MIATPIKIRTRFGGQSGGAPVVTAPVLLTDLNERLTSVGTARALKSVVIYAENSGRVTAVNIKADSLVADSTNAAATR